MSPRTINRLRSLAAAGATLVALAIPTAATAGPLVANAPSCDSQLFSQPFLPWADVASYTIDPGGTFEAGSPGWALSGGAGVVAGNEPYRVTSAADNSSLALPAGSSAVSRSLCVGIEHPDIRFFARSTNPALGAHLNVEVLFEDGFGTAQSLQIGTIAAGQGWAPTAPLPIVVNLLPLLPGNHTAVAFRFTAAGGAFQIDDVYVDPYMK
jgi:hypothetical protein